MCCFQAKVERGHQWGSDAGRRRLRRGDEGSRGMMPCTAVTREAGALERPRRGLRASAARPREALSGRELGLPGNSPGDTGRECAGKGDGRRAEPGGR